MGISPASSFSSPLSSSTSTFAFPIFAPNISHVLPVKLDRNNFLLWRSQFLPILRLHNAMGYVDGSYPCPPQFTLDNRGNITDVVNPDFLKWQTQDQTLLSWFLSSLTEPILAQVVGLSTAKDVWQTLKCIYSAQSRAKIMPLKYQLHTLKKGSLSMSDYVQKKKSIADNLAAVAQPVSDSDLASSLLSGLSSEYEAFITSMTIRFEPISHDELTGFLLSQEAHLEENSVAIDMPAANVASHSAGSAFRGRGRHSAGVQVHIQGQVQMQDYSQILVYDQVHLQVEVEGHVQVQLQLYGRTKHVEIDVHFVHDLITKRRLDVRYLSTVDQLADIFTKPLG